MYLRITRARFDPSTYDEVLRLSRGATAAVRQLPRGHRDAKLSRGVGEAPAEEGRSMTTVVRAGAAGVALADEALVARAQAGDHAAFALLVERHQGKVYALACRLLGNAADAEDAAQETFVRAYTRLGTYRPGGKFASWLRAITAHWCLDLGRARRRRVQTVALGRVPESDRFLPREDGPEELVAGRVTADEVQGWLAALAPPHRAVLVLRHLHDLSYDEIAAALGEPVTTVRMRLFHARRQLQAVAARERAASAELGAVAPLGAA